MLHVLEKFNQSSKEPIHIPRIDQVPMYPAWLLAWGLSHTRCKPEWLVILGFLLTLFCAAALPSLINTPHVWLVTVGLGLIIILDCADGRLARITGQIRSIGGLADLASDFTHNILWHISIAIVLIQHQSMTTLEAILLSTTGFLAAIFGTTLYSYLNFRRNHPEAEPSIFIDAIPPDNHAIANKKTYKTLAFVHALGWGLVAQKMLYLQTLKTVQPPQKTMHFIAFNAAGSNIMLAMVVLVAGWPLSTYLYTEIFLCCAAYGVLLIHPRTTFPHKKTAA